MWIENTIFKNDLDFAINVPFIPWESFEGKTFFITGVTGLIGYTLTATLLYQSVTKKSGIKVIALVRDVEKAKEQFRDILSDGASLSFIHGDVENIPEISENIDFIIHCACPTESSFFLYHPVETIKIIIDGTFRVLNLAREKNIKSMVYLSSMEVFGEILTKKKLSESDLGSIDLSTPRSSYAEAKRLAENMCTSYFCEYNTPVKIARLVQTFGPGIKYEDNRVFAYMLRCVLENKNIELKTSGEKENSYLYTMDGVTAILVMLAKGMNGKVYNVANEETYCSVKKMGQIVLDTFKKINLSVLTNVDNNDNSNNRTIRESNNDKNIKLINSLYRPDGYLNVSTKQLEKLFWKAETKFEKMLKNTIPDRETK